MWVISYVYSRLIDWLSLAGRRVFADNSIDDQNMSKIRRSNDQPQNDASCLPVIDVFCERTRTELDEGREGRNESDLTAVPEFSPRDQQHTGLRRFIESLIGLDEYGDALSLNGDVCLALVSYGAGHRHSKLGHSSLEAARHWH